MDERIDTAVLFLRITQSAREWNVVGWLVDYLCIEYHSIQCILLY
jgi:hypothetical protein